MTSSLGSQLLASLQHLQFKWQQHLHFSPCLLTTKQTQAHLQKLEDLQFLEDTAK